MIFQKCYIFLFLSDKAFVTTKSELNDIAKAPIIGVSKRLNAL